MHHEPVKPETLSDDHRRKWGNTLTLFTLACPGFRHILYKLLANNAGTDIALMSRTVPLAATDGANVIINPDQFFQLTLKERVFVLAHEVIHNVYDDPATTRRIVRSGELRYGDGVSLPFENNLWQKAMDFRINDALIKSAIGAMPVTKDGKPIGCHDTKIGKADDSAYDIYRRLYEQEKGGGGKKGEKDKTTGGTSEGPGAFDECMEPGTSTGQDPNVAGAQRNAQQWASEMAVAQSLELMKLQGKISADLKRMFDLYLKRQVPWTDHIEGFFARKIGSGASDWRRPDRRFITRDIYIPARSGHGVNWVCVWGDTSGSIGRDELNTYFAELSGLIDELQPRRVTVFWCDAQIKHTDDIEDMDDLTKIRARGVGGGGGTSCRPVFRAIRDMNMEPPDAFVGLTDGHAEFPSHAPNYPCVWAVTTDAEIPFGETVRIKPVVE